MKATFTISKTVYYEKVNVEIPAKDEKRIREYAAKNNVSLDEAFRWLANTLEIIADVSYDYNWYDYDYTVDTLEIEA